MVYDRRKDRASVTHVNVPDYEDCEMDGLQACSECGHEHFDSKTIAYVECHVCDCSLNDYAPSIPVPDITDPAWRAVYSGECHACLTVWSATCPVEYANRPEFRIRCNYVVALTDEGKPITCSTSIKMVRKDTSMV